MQLRQLMFDFEDGELNYKDDGTFPPSGTRTPNYKLEIDTNKDMSDDNGNGIEFKSATSPDYSLDVSGDSTIEANPESDGPSLENEIEEIHAKLSKLEAIVNKTLKRKLQNVMREVREDSETKDVAYAGSILRKETGVIKDRIDKIRDQVREIVDRLELSGESF